MTLITMHSCKGLEFPHVYIAGMEDGLLPHTRSKVEGTLDEERRLFYVAVTRAMEKLTITHCSARKKYGQANPCQPSPTRNARKAPISFSRNRIYAAVMPSQIWKRNRFGMISLSEVSSFRAEMFTFETARRTHPPHFAGALPTTLPQS